MPMAHLSVASTAGALNGRQPLLRRVALHLVEHILLPPPATTTTTTTAAATATSKQTIKKEEKETIERIKK